MDICKIEVGRVSSYPEDSGEFLKVNWDTGDLNLPLDVIVDTLTQAVVYTIRSQEPDPQRQGKLVDKTISTILSVFTEPSIDNNIERIK